MRAPPIILQSAIPTLSHQVPFILRRIQFNDAKVGHPPPPYDHLPFNSMASPLRQPLGTFTEAGPHPSRGGNPYSDDYRNDVVTRYQLGIPLDTPTLNALRDEHAYHASSSRQTTTTMSNKHHLSTTTEVVQQRLSGGEAGCSHIHHSLRRTYQDLIY